VRPLEAEVLPELEETVDERQRDRRCHGILL
jgi:hypothetical protein